MNFLKLPYNNFVCTSQSQCLSFHSLATFDYIVSHWWRNRVQYAFSYWPVVSVTTPSNVGSLTLYLRIMKKWYASLWHLFNIAKAPSRWLWWIFSSPNAARTRSHFVHAFNEVHTPHSALVFMRNKKRKKKFQTTARSRTHTHTSN